MKDIQLFRIDDRLIHGQVVITWATVLNTDTVILCDNSVYENEWEKDLYLSCAPDYLTIKIFDVAGTIELLKDSSQDFSHTIFLVNGPQVVEELLAAGVTVGKVNVGGIHFREGREKYLPYLYLDKHECDSFSRCLEKGIQFECLDVPTGTKVDLKNLIT